MDEVNQAMSEIAGEVGAEIGSAIFAVATGDEDFGVSVTHGELDVGVCFVVAQEDVEARLALLDEVVFKSEGFTLIGDGDVFDVNSFSHERAGLAIVELVGLKEVRADPGAQIFGFADVDYDPFGIFVEVAAGGGGNGPYFFEKVHA